MKKPILSYFAALFALLLSITAEAESAIAKTGTTRYNGHHLQMICNLNNYKTQNNDWWLCVAFVQGYQSGIVGGLQWSAIVDYTNKNGPPTPNKIDRAKLDEYLHNYVRDRWTVCPPDNVSDADAALSVTKFLDSNKDRLNEPEGGLVMKALMLAYPCRRQ